MILSSDRLLIRHLYAGTGIGAQQKVCYWMRNLKEEDVNNKILTIIIIMMIIIIIIIITKRRKRRIIQIKNNIYNGNVYLDSAHIHHAVMLMVY